MNLEMTIAMEMWSRNRLDSLVLTALESSVLSNRSFTCSACAITDRSWSALVMQPSLVLVTTQASTTPGAVPGHFELGRVIVCPTVGGLTRARQVRSSSVFNRRQLERHQSYLRFPADFPGRGFAA